MRFPRARPLALLLLALMLTTFLSPSFGWHMQAGHHEIAAEAHSAHGHDHDGDHHANDGPADAHASIGHLLGHLPMQLSQFRVLIPLAEDVAPSAEIPLPLFASETTPPYRPPLDSCPA